MLMPGKQFCKLLVTLQKWEKQPQKLSLMRRTAAGMTVGAKKHPSAGSGAACMLLEQVCVSPHLAVLLAVHSAASFAAEHHRGHGGMAQQWGSSPDSSAALLLYVRNWGKTKKISYPNTTGQESLRLGSTWGSERVEGRSIPRDVQCLGAQPSCSSRAWDFAGSGSGHPSPQIQVGLQQMRGYTDEMKLCRGTALSKTLSWAHSVLLSCRVPILAWSIASPFNAGREPIADSQRDDKLVKEFLKSYQYWESSLLHCLSGRFH